MHVPPLGREGPLEKGMATHSSILAWRIPWTEEPGGLQSMGSHRVRHDWSDLAYMHTPTHACTQACPPWEGAWADLWGREELIGPGLKTVAGTFNTLREKLYIAKATAWYPHVHSSTNHNSQDVEVTQVSIDRGMNRMCLSIQCSITLP